MPEWPKSIRLVEKSPNRKLGWLLASHIILIIRLPFSFFKELKKPGSILAGTHNAIEHVIFERLRFIRMGR
jgi:hypothetical protein